MKVFKDTQFTTACGTDVSYGFYGRTGGTSAGIYSSLNCGPGSGDDTGCVAKNRSIVAQDLCGMDVPISTLWQCHTPDCLSIHTHVAADEDRPKGDALVTDVAGLAIGVLTADCGPVLFTANKPDGAPVIGAAHAGWGGALNGVLESTVDALVQKGAVAGTIKACVGPCIGAASYEVSESFMRPFIIKHEEAEHFFKSAHKAGHFMFDLPGYLAFRLSLCGVTQVSLMGVDTYTDEAHNFSYRRAKHRGEGNYGRQISAIVINA